MIGAWKSSWPAAWLVALLLVAVAAGAYVMLRPAPGAPAATRPTKTPAPRDMVDLVDGRRIRIFSDIVYGSAPSVDAYDQTLDLYIPEGERLPVLIFVHGGGWTGGDKYFAQQGRFFASKGLLVASINYRLREMTGPPNAATDIAAAVSYLRSVAPSFNGDASRLFLMGHSAGAHLTALCVSDERYLDQGSASAIRGVILLDSSGYNVPEMMTTWRGPLYANAFAADAELWYAVSPYHYARDRVGLPPFLLVHADNDAIRERAAKRFAWAVNRGGGSARLLAAPDEDHISVQENLAMPGNPVAAEILRFISEPR